MFSDTTNYIRVDRDGAQDLRCSVSQDTLQELTQSTTCTLETIMNVVLGGASARFEQMGTTDERPILQSPSNPTALECHTEIGNIITVSIDK